MISTPRDANFVPAVQVKDVSTALATAWSGININGFELGMIAIVDGSGSVASLPTQYSQGASISGTVIGNAIVYGNTNANTWQYVDGQHGFPTDFTTIATTAVSVNSGTMDAGTQRVALATDSPGVAQKSIKTVTGTASSNGSNTIIAAVSSKRIKICAYSLMTASTTAVTCTFKDGTGGTQLWTVGPLQALTSTSYGANLAVAAPAFIFGVSAGNLLDLTLSAAQSVIYSVSYYDDDAT